MYSNQCGPSATLFSNKVRANTSSVKINSVYQIIEILIARRDELVAPYDLLNPKNKIDTADRQAYLLKFAKDGVNNLYDATGFDINERHLTVDKYYSLATAAKGHSGFAAAHYTENYVHASGARKTVHVYFIPDGTYVQIKSAATESDPMVQEEVPASSAFTNSIQNNAYQALRLYSRLQSELATEWENLNIKADLIEQELTKLSYDLNTDETKIRYIAQAKQFIELINNMNALNEFSTDFRGEQVQKRINYVQELSVTNNPSGINAEITVEEMVSATQSASSNEEPKPQPINTRALKQKQNHEQLLQKLAALETQLDNAKTNKDTAEYYFIAKEIKTLSFELNFSTHVTEEDEKNINKLHYKIPVLAPAQEFTTSQFKNGNTKAFITMLPTLSNVEQTYVIKEIFNIIANQNHEHDKVNVAQREMCEFLYQNSPAYKFRINLETDIVYFVDGSKIGFSMLLYFFMKKHPLTFSMLLRHGVTPNRADFIHDDTCQSLMKLIIGLSETDYYIKEMLAHGAIVDYQPKLDAYNMKQFNNAVRHNSGLSSKDTMLKELVEKDLLHYKLNLYSDLVLVCRAANFNLIPLFLEQSNITALVLAFITLINNKLISQRQAPEFAEGEIIFNSAADANIATAKLKPRPRSMALYFYSTEPDSRKKTKRIEAIRIVYNFMMSKLKNTDQELIKLLEELESIETNYNKGSNEAVYLACKFLICKKGVLSEFWAEKTMQYYCKLALIYKRSEFPNLAITNYYYATILGKNCNLQHTPLYMHAEKNFFKLSNNPNILFSKSVIQTQVSTSDSNSNTNVL